MAGVQTDTHAHLLSESELQREFRERERVTAQCSNLQIECTARLDTISRFVSSSPGTMSLPEDSESRPCEDLSLSSRGTYIVEWRQSDFSQCDMGRLSRSDSLQAWMFPPLPGQVPVEPSPGQASPANKSSTEIPTKSEKKKKKKKRKKGLGSFLKGLWKAVSSPFRSCFLKSDVDVVEPFVPPLDLESEPDSEPASPVPGCSGVQPYDDSFETLYEVGEMIGSGGFGRVFEGTRIFDGKRVAIKRMRKDASEDRYIAIPGHPKPLITEVALLLKMRQEPISPYTIQLYDWFEHPRKFTLVMEFPEPCESLLDFINCNSQLDETTAWFIMTQAVLAVQHCLEHGVFHNDVHAGNFLLKRDTLTLKLIDFGSGQLLSSEGYESEGYVGLLDYCPPEVFTQPRYHAVPSNVWSLGVLLHEMMYGCTLPYSSPKEIKEATVTCQNPDLSEGLDTHHPVCKHTGLNAGLDGCNRATTPELRAGPRLSK